MPEGPFRPDWKSLEGYEVPEWYLDAKFGIFVHWGVYSVPAFQNEWYPRNMYLEGEQAYEHHLETYGPQGKFGYKDFIPSFKAERWDPAEWAELFKKSGAKYVVLVAEHHDGFAMYDCGYGGWNSAKMGPKRDVVRELSDAVRGQGLAFGVSYHRAEHWWFFEGGMRFDSDVKDPRYQGLYGPAKPGNTQPDEGFLEEYRPQIFWFDWWIEQPSFEPYLKRFAAYYYNRGAQWNLGVAINYKHNSFPEKTAVLDVERGKLDTLRSRFWQTDTSVCKKSWGYIKDHEYKTAGSIVLDLVDIVSKNGCLLLNVAPRPDGTIPEEQRQILLEVGRWLEANGEAVYGTRPWIVYGEGPTRSVGGEFKDQSEPFTGRDIRFTTRDGALYAVALAWPGEELVVQSLSTNLRLYQGEVGSVRLLGSEEPVEWSRGESGLRVKMPTRRPCDHAFALRIDRKE
ncbi:MAG: alpha-L-fucosidase [Candidatus Brockarchaeota archaeon]|nr:alpha-L-fucosidase [Candidatus Brockarchaeota archaeon]